MGIKRKIPSFIEDIANIPSDLLRGASGVKGFIYLTLFGWIFSNFITDVFYKPTNEQYKVLFSAIGLCCTFAALSFAGSNAILEKAKEHLRASGIKLFVAGLHATKALLLRYLFDVLQKPEFWDSLRLTSFITSHINIQRTLLTIPYVSACIFMGLCANLIVNAIHDLNKAFKLSKDVA